MTWTISYNKFDPKDEPLREVLCSLGNGYLGVRSAYPETPASENHYPATYIAGVSNRLWTKVSGKNISNEDMVNCPNWTGITFKIGKGEWVSPETAKMSAFSQELDLKSGTFNRKLIYTDSKGRKTQVQEIRIVSMDNPHLAAIKYTIKPLNYSDEVRVRTSIDGSVENTGVKRYLSLNHKHLRPLKQESKGKVRVLSVITSQSKITISQAYKVRIFSGKKELQPKREAFTKGKNIIGEEFSFSAAKARSYSIEKVVGIYTSLEERYPHSAAVKLHKKPFRFEVLLKAHKKAWAALWKIADIVVEGDEFSQQVLRFHAFHLCGRDKCGKCIFRCIAPGDISARLRPEARAKEICLPIRE